MSYPLAIIGICLFILICAALIRVIERSSRPLPGVRRTVKGIDAREAQQIAINDPKASAASVLMGSRPWIVIIDGGNKAHVLWSVKAEVLDVLRSSFGTRWLAMPTSQMASDADAYAHDDMVNSVIVLGFILLMLFAGLVLWVGLFGTNLA